MIFKHKENFAWAGAAALIATVINMVRYGDWSNALFGAGLTGFLLALAINYLIDAMGHWFSNKP